MIIGYARVSTLDQNEKSQLELLENKGCERIFLDKDSGVNDNRTEFLIMKSSLRKGDTLIVVELSRLGRRLLSVLEFIEHLKQNEINFISLRENIDISSPSGTLIMQIMASVSEFERKRLLERQKLGIIYAKNNGVRFGRPKTSDKDLEKAVKLYESKTMSIKEICELTGVSKSVLYRRIKES